MAIIQISFDTVAKSLSATMDGQELGDVVGVYIGRCCGYGADDDEFSCELTMATSDKVAKTTTMTRVMASEHELTPVRDSATDPVCRAVADYLSRD
jgi:hypothetical protein